MIALWAAAQEANYPTGIWATYRQWTELGAQVRKGERRCLVVFWKVYNRDEADQDGDATTPDDEGGGSERRRFFARGYTVFNASQVDGFAVAAPPEPPVVERNMRAERFLDALDITTVFGGDRAFYRPSTDTIHLPRFEIFRDATSAYAVRVHESAHATGAPHRLARDLSGRFGSNAYAAEELVAELTAAFVCAYLGLSSEPRPDHAAYVASWLKVLRGDKRAIFSAAAQAERAADWMHQRRGITRPLPHARRTGQGSGPTSPRSAPLPRPARRGGQKWTSGKSEDNRRPDPAREADPHPTTIPCPLPAERTVPRA